MGKLILLPFTVGCISESSIPVVVQHTKRSKLDKISTLTSTEKEDGYLDSPEKLPPENLKRFQKLFKNFKILSHFPDNEETKVEEEMKIDIGFPTDVTHVTHIGLDDFHSSDLMRSWKDLIEPEYDINVIFTSETTPPFWSNKM